MSIEHITQAPGFNQQQYDMLLQQAKRQSVSDQAVESAILAELNNGKSFVEAMNSVSTQLPRLAPPNGSEYAKIMAFGGAPSPGALVLTLITEMAMEQRQDNAQLRWQQAETNYEMGMQAADKLREKAVVVLAFSITANVVNGISGAIQAKVASSGTTETAPLVAQQAAGIGAVGNAVGGTLNALGTYAGTGYDADIKRIEANQEKLRAKIDVVKSLDENWKEVIRKSTAAYEAIQGGYNQSLAGLVRVC